MSIIDKKKKKILEEIVLKLNKENYSSELDFVKKFRKVFSQAGLEPHSKATLISIYRQLLKSKKIKANSQLEILLKKRAVRTLSGVSVITVLTKPFPCPGQCIYCPAEPKMPKSYLSNEPAAQRAKRNLFDPIKQVSMRLQALINNGHQVDKLEILVLGGTWSAYPKIYQKNFVRDLFYVANTFRPLASKKSSPKKSRPKYTLLKEQKINEKTKYKIIGLTLETRPDFINELEIKKLRELGCTRVQIGVQHTDNKILTLIHRGHSIDDSIKATQALKEVGLKVDHHYMPDLPGSTPAKDLKMFEYVFSSPDLQPDQIKIYPCIVNSYAPLYQWLKSGKYKPYSPKQLITLLLKVKELTPPWLRINRLIRDIPKESIVAGNKVTNLRQYLQAELKKQGKSCQCLRCREVRHDSQKIAEAILVKRQYSASGGQEIFLSFESSDKKIVYAFLRLRFNQNPTRNIFPELKNSALIRELHVYGQMKPVYNENSDEEIGQTQHLGLGKKLMQEAEKISQEKAYKKIAVISGIGVRNYYRKLGYRLAGTYMTKSLTKNLKYN